MIKREALQRVAREQTMRFRAAENAPAGYEVVETYADGGRIVRSTETGRESYISDGYATSDPEQITRIRSREGRAGEVVSGQMAKDIVGGLPTGIVSAFKGVPVLRGYVEPIVAAGAKGIGAVQDILPEALGGGGAPSASQADIESLLRQAVTEREREAPIATAASRLGAGLATGYVAAPLAPAYRAVHHYHRRVHYPGGLAVGQADWRACAANCLRLSRRQAHGTGIHSGRRQQRTRSA